ncbi:MAG: RNA methyltransferase [Cyclobacteriaceae bacterium]|nr:RNA methyltransferase [Cyclobacteriaceae bacterium]
MTQGNFSAFEKITSTANLKIKNFQHLQKARERKKQHLFVVEGTKEIEMAINAGYNFSQFFYCPEILNPAFFDLIREKLGEKVIVNEVTRDVYNHISYREDAEGITGWAVPWPHALLDLKPGRNPLVLVLESVEKPGNLGAILRTADAAGLDAVIICDPQTDIYNPNVIRSSLGAVFTVPIGIASTQETIIWLKEYHMAIFCTSLTASIPYTNINFSVPSAIVMGSEATGLSVNWLKFSDRNIIIPMKGKVDSMNVSVSAGIVIFEALRQRKQRRK